MEPEKPDLPPVKDMQAGEKGDPPQIKGPVELPDKKSGEEVQLDRPDAGDGGHTVHTVLPYRQLTSCVLSLLIELHKI